MNLISMKSGPILHINFEQKTFMQFLKFDLNSQQHLKPFFFSICRRSFHMMPGNLKTCKRNRDDCKENKNFFLLLLIHYLCCYYLFIRINIRKIWRKSLCIILWLIWNWVLTFYDLKKKMNEKSFFFCKFIVCNSPKKKN